MAKNGPSCGTDLDLVKRELIALLNIKSKNYRGVGPIPDRVNQIS